MSIIWWAAIIGGVIGLINYTFCIGGRIYIRFRHDGHGGWPIYSLIPGGVLRTALIAGIGALIGWSIR